MPGSEGLKMKSAFAKNFSYIGAGTGLALFAIFGLLYGSFIGGSIGLNIVSTVYGEPLGDSAIIARVIVSLGMISGVLIACALSVVGCAALGWISGFVIDRLLWVRERAHQKEAFNR